MGGGEGAVRPLSHISTYLADKSLFTKTGDYSILWEKVRGGTYYDSNDTPYGLEFMEYLWKRY